MLVSSAMKESLGKFSWKSVSCTVTANDQHFRGATLKVFKDADVFGSKLKEGFKKVPASDWARLVASSFFCTVVFIFWSIRLKILTWTADEWLKTGLATLIAVMTLLIGILVLIVIGAVFAKREYVPKER
jgi:hypothetical protein